jgi:hypothetical protein
MLFILAITKDIGSCNIIRMCRLLKSRRLETINCLGQNPMKKSILDVELMNGPVAGNY